MRPSFIADTGLIVAYLNAEDQDHEWADAQVKKGPLPFLTCDPVLTEATFLLARDGLPREHVLDLVRERALVSAFDINQEAAAVAVLLARYYDVPMDFVDACLVRMAELHPDATVLTLDGDFRVYRRFSREAVPVVMPQRG